MPTVTHIEGELGPPELSFSPQTPAHPAGGAAAASQIHVWPWQVLGRKGFWRGTPPPPQAGLATTMALASCLGLLVSGLGEGWDPRAGRGKISARGLAPGPGEVSMTTYTCEAVSRARPQQQPGRPRPHSTGHGRSYSLDPTP